MAQAKTTTKKGAAANTQVREAGMPESQAPAVQNPQSARPQRPLTVAERRKHTMGLMLSDIMSSREDLERFLNAQGISFDFFYASLQQALMTTTKNDPEFFDRVTKDSFITAVFKAANDGLMCDGREAAIARFGTEATYMPMVGGYLKKAHQSGLIADINHNVVTEAEDEAGRFEYEEGTQGFIRHRPMLTRKDTDKIVAAYCVVKTVNGGEYREVVPEADLVKIRSVSRATKGPRKDWPLEMDRKSALRRVFKRIPHDKGLAQLLKHDDEAYAKAPRIGAGEETDAPRVDNAALFAPTAQHKVVEPQPNAEVEDVEFEPEDPVVEEVKTVEEEPKKKPRPKPADKAPNQGPIVDQMMKLIRGTTSLGELAEVIHDLPSHKHAKDLTKASQAIINQACIDQKEKLGGAAPMAQDDDEAPAERRPLEAVMRTGGVARVFDDEKTWRDDVLTKMDSLSGADLKAFWTRNVQFFERAREDGYEGAERIFEVAKAKGVLR